MTRKSKTIEIDLEIYRLIATNRLSFDETETEILRRLLGLKPVGKQQGNERGINIGYGVMLPEGTLLKREYNRGEVQAEVDDDSILCNGKRYKSPSGAAKKFGGPNGWTFWYVKRPQDSEWVLLDELRNKESIIKRSIRAPHIHLSQEDLADMPD
jgi:hypothetical protein